MKIALLCNLEICIKKVYSTQIIEKLNNLGEVSEIISIKNLEKNKEFLQQTEIVFSTWGMPSLTKEQIQEFLPKLKAVFYAAGTVQKFARPFLELGIKVFSAWQANGIPVAEFTFAQISLANKGYFLSTKKYKINPLGALLHKVKHIGNYQAKIGIVGLGAIGSNVCEKLKALNCEVLAYDPFVSEEKAKALGVKLVDLKTIFSECNVISNHLANKKELWGIYNMKLFKLMKPYSTFINTGRGRQVKEWQLAFYLLTHPKQTAVLDVLTTDISFLSPLWFCRNAICSPHIAGSMGQEDWRMAEYMLEEYDRYSKNLPTKYEVTIEMLKTMA